LGEVYTQKAKEKYKKRFHSSNIGGRGAQCQQSDLRWTKVKQALAIYETKNP